MKRKLIDGDEVVAVILSVLAAVVVFFLLFDLVLALLSRAG